MDQTSWKSYEDVARYLLAQMAQEFGLRRVEGKQTVKGLRSGTHWEIEAKGVRADDNEAFIIIECRRYTKVRQKQEQIGALAYRIVDTGAAGAILMSPLGMQEGAARIAEAEDIQNVTLSENSTPQDYMLRFLNKVFIGVSEHATVTDHATVKVIRASEQPTDE